MLMNINAGFFLEEEKHYHQHHYVKAIPQCISKPLFNIEVEGWKIKYNLI